MNAFIPRGRLHRALVVKTVTRLALRLLVMPSPVLGACRRLVASFTKPLCRQHLKCRFPSAIGLQVTIAPEIFDGLMIGLHHPWLLHDTAAPTHPQQQQQQQQQRIGTEKMIRKRESSAKIYSVWRGTEGRAKLRLRCCEGSQPRQ